MISLKSLMIVSASLALLNGCSSDTTTTGGNPISVISVSGVMVSLDGSYSTDCVDRSLEGGSDYYKSTKTISGSSLVGRSAEYSDSACTAETDFGTVEGTISAGNISAITGWIGITGGAPTASDGSGPLSDTEAVTLLTVTVTAVSGFNAGLPLGTAIPVFYVVDDTGVKNIHYEDDDAFGGSTLAKNAGGSTEL